MKLNDIRKMASIPYLDDDNLEVFLLGEDRVVFSNNINDIKIFNYKTREWEKSILQN